VGYNPQKETLKQYEEKLRDILEKLEQAGCRDILNGIHWDEPYYNNYTPKNLQDQMKINYTVFGLRNFVVFGLPEFSEVNPRENKNGDPMPQISAKYSKYLTDAAFDYYTVDVREGKSNGGAYDFYSNVLGVNIKTGKDIYIAYKNKLKNDIGHPISLWHFSCAYEMPTWASVTADEDYCMENLRFLANDVINDSNPGGVALYTYYTHTQSHGRTALQERIPIKDKNGNYTRFPQTEKWENYFKLVKTYSDIFSSVKYKRINIGI